MVSSELQEDDHMFFETFVAIIQLIFESTEKNTFNLYIYILLVSKIQEVCK